MDSREKTTVLAFLSKFFRRGLVCVNKVESKWGLLLFMFCGVFMDFD